MCRAEVWKHNNNNNSKNNKGVTAAVVFHWNGNELLTLTG